MNAETIAANAAERGRLAALAGRLTDDDLRCDLGGGWTVAAAFAHLAFWELRSLALLHRWQREGVGPSPIDIDITNRAILPLCLAIPPRAAAELAIRAAEEIDREIEALQPDLIAAIEGLSGRFRFRRWEHRREHLDQIEAALSARAVGSTTQPAAG